MIDYPQTLEEAEAYRYNRWGGNPNGDKYDKSCCAGEGYDSVSSNFYQCSRKKSKGPAGLYCWQHAKKAEKK